LVPSFLTRKEPGRSICDKAVYFIVEKHLSRFSGGAGPKQCGADLGSDVEVYDDLYGRKGFALQSANTGLDLMVFGFEH